jgi:hypothetical protein
MAGAYGAERSLATRTCPACGGEAAPSVRICPACGEPLPEVEAAQTWGHVQYLLGETNSWERDGTVPADACRWVRAEYGARAETLAREIRAEDHLARARRLTEIGQPGEAIARCRQALALEPDRVEAWELLSRLCASLGHWEDALEALEEGLRRAPDDARLLLLRDRLRSRVQADAEAARARPVAAALPLGAAGATPHAADPVSAAVVALPPAPAPPWWQPLAAFLEERNIKYWHGVGILVLLGGLLGLVQWQWDLLGRWVILGMLFGLTAGSYALGRRLGPEYQVSRTVLLALAGLLLPLDLATVHAFLPLVHRVDASSARLAIALLCLPIYARAAWRLREPLFVAFASAASAGAAHFALQLLLPGPHGPTGEAASRILLPDLYRHDGLLLLPLAGAHVLLACRLAREGLVVLARPLLLAAQVLAGLGMAAALVGAPGGGGVAGIARDAGLPAVLLLGVLFYGGSAYLFDDSRYLRVAAVALAVLAVAGRHAAGATALPWHAYLPFLTLAAALLVCGSVADEAARGAAAQNRGERFVTEYRRDAQALLGLLLATLLVRWLFALGVRQVPAGSAELTTLSLVAAAGTVLYVWLSYLQGAPGLLYLAGGSLGASLLGLVLRLDDSADRLALGPALALAAGACAVSEALLRRRGHVAFARPLAEVAFVMRLAAAGWVAYRYGAAVALGLPVGAPRLAALVTLITLTAPTTTLAFTERRPRALYGAIAYGAAACLLGIAALWDGPAARLVPWGERNYGLMLAPLAVALAVAADRARHRPAFARPAYHSAAVMALGILAYQAAWMALSRGVVLLLLGLVGAMVARLLWVGLTSPPRGPAPAAERAVNHRPLESAAPPPPRSGEGSWAVEGDEESLVPEGTRTLSARFGWLLVVILGVPVALDAAGVLGRLPLQPAMGPTVWLGLAAAAALCIWLTHAGDRSAYGTAAFAAVLPYAAVMAGYGVLWQSFALTAPQGMVWSAIGVARDVAGAAAACAAAIAAERLGRRQESRWRAPLAWSACAAALAFQWDAVGYAGTHLPVMAAFILALGAFAAASVTLRRRWVAAGGVALFLLGLALLNVAGGFGTTTAEWRTWFGTVERVCLFGAVVIVGWVALRFRSAWFAGSSSLLLAAAMLDWTNQVAGTHAGAACLAMAGLLVPGLKQVAALLARGRYTDLAPGPARVGDLLAVAVGWGLLAQLGETGLAPATAVAGGAVAVAYAEEARQRHRPWLLYPAMAFAAGGWTGVVIAWLLPVARWWGWEPNAALGFVPLGAALAAASLHREWEPAARRTGGAAGDGSDDAQTAPSWSLADRTSPLRHGAALILGLVALAQLDALQRGWWATAAVAWACVGAVAATAAVIGARLPAPREREGEAVSPRAETWLHALVAAAAVCALGAAYAGARWLGWGPVWAPLGMLAPTYGAGLLGRRAADPRGYAWDRSLAVLAAGGAAFAAGVSGVIAADNALPGDTRALALTIAAVATCHLHGSIADRRAWHGLTVAAVAILAAGYGAADVGRLPAGAPVLASHPWLWGLPAFFAAVMIGYRPWRAGGGVAGWAGSRLILACASATGGTIAALWHAGLSLAGIGIGLACVAGLWALIAASRLERGTTSSGLTAVPFTVAAATCAALGALLALAALAQSNTGRFTVAALLLASGTYAGLGVLHRARSYAHMAFGCAMTAYALWLYDRFGIGAGNLDFYLIPIGLYALLLGHWLRRFRGSGGEELLPLETAGLLLALGPTLLASFHDTGAAHSWLLLTECLLAIFWGVARRVRVYAGLGTLFLVALLGQHAYEPLAHVHWAIYATVIGLAIIVSAVGFERRRAEVLGWAARVADELRRWD